MSGTLDAGTDLDRFFDCHYRLQPVTATFVGETAWDDQLPDWSCDGLAAANDDITALQRHLRDERHGRHGTSTLALDRMLADAHLDIAAAEYSGTHFQRANPALYTGEAAFGIISLMLRWTNVDSVGQSGDPDDDAQLERPIPDGYGAIESRLNHIPTFLGTAQQTIGGRSIPQPWVERALGECRGATRLLSHGLPCWLASTSMSTGRQSKLVEAAARAQRGFAVFASWLRGKSTAESGALVGSPEFFDLLLERGHWLSVTRADLLAEAKERFAESQATVDTHAAKLDSRGWDGVKTTLAREHPTADEYLSAFTDTWEAARQTCEDQGVVTWPTMPVRFLPMPLWARDAAPFLYFLYYRSPPARVSSRRVLVFVPPIPAGVQAESAALRATNTSVIKLNFVVHHAGPGHHLQNTQAYRSSSRIGQSAAVDGASRINMFCGGTMAEGWACYITDVLDEFGFMTPYEQVAHKHNQMRHLARAIVDIELHQNTMTFADACRFYEDHIQMSPAGAHKEATRNSMFPGTGIMYWMGTQTIHQLRREIERRAARSFSLRQFHDELLAHGSVPVSLIRQLRLQGGPS